MEYMFMPLKRYADFSGRSRRKEYWMWFLFLIIVTIVTTYLDILLGLGGSAAGTQQGASVSFNVNFGLITILFLLAVLVPNLAVGVRRLHDIGRSGWWLLAGYGAFAASTALALAGFARWEYFLSLAAGIGFLVLLVFSVMEGNRGPNRFGEDPKAGEPPEPGAA